MIKFLLPKSFTQWFFQQILYHAMLNCTVCENGAC